MEINIHEQRSHCICIHLGIFSFCSWCSREDFSNPEHQPQLMRSLCVFAWLFFTLSVADSTLHVCQRFLSFLGWKGLHVCDFQQCCVNIQWDSSVQNPLVEKKCFATCCGDSILIGHLYFASDLTYGRIHRDTVSYPPISLNFF